MVPYIAGRALQTRSEGRAATGSTISMMIGVEIAILLLLVLISPVSGAGFIQLGWAWILVLGICAILLSYAVAAVIGKIRRTC